MLLLQLYNQFLRKNNRDCLRLNIVSYITISSEIFHKVAGGKAY